MSSTGSHRQLIEEHRLTGPTGNATANYAVTKYTYGPSTDSKNAGLLTQITDPRGVNVLANTYGTSTGGVPDGHLATQTDAANHTSTYTLSNLASPAGSSGLGAPVLTVSSTVNSQTITATVTHDLYGNIQNVRAADADTGTAYSYDPLGR